MFLTARRPEAGGRNVGTCAPNLAAPPGAASIVCCRLKFLAGSRPIMDLALDGSRAQAGLALLRFFEYPGQLLSLSRVSQERVQDLPL